MSVRQWIDNNPGTLVGVTLVAVCLALIVAFWYGLGGPSAPGAAEAYYLDPETNRLYTADRHAYPPISTPTGGEDGLRVHIYACGDCPPDLADRAVDELDGTDAFAAYFERYTDHALEMRARGLNGDDPTVAEYEVMEALEEGRLIRAPDQREWVQADSEAGRRLAATAQERCGDEAPVACYP